MTAPEKKGIDHLTGFADTITVLFLSRAFHGIAGTGIEISGISYLAVRYQDDENLKGFVLGMVISSFAFGTLIGPTIGSVMYGLISQSAPFLAISVIILASLVFTPMVMPMNVTVPVTESSPSAITLVMNPCTLLVSVLALTTTLGIAFTNATLPIWLKSSFKTPEWEIGLIFVPTSAAHIVSGPLIGYWSKTLKRWRCMLIGSLAMAIGIATLPLCIMIWQLIPSMTLVGFGFGTVDSTLIGIMYRIVDVWHEGAQSSAAAVFVFEFCLAYTIGLLTSGTIIGFIGFKWTMWSLAITIVVSSPFCLLLSRIPEERETEQPLLPKPEVLLPSCLPTTIEDKPQPLPDESTHLIEG
ncbi:chromaffin granule amine transporter-like [Lytechinus variegatus]|uniref:chromaffin granule amine transporter-like n=1 Tax=Lytechinus variegatus TaxID=7654 RepID=UPI001BB1CA8F|nr:chromaffin granule amine transporter-like [Lytechinus variegatus]